MADAVVRRRCRGWRIAPHVRDDLRSDVMVHLLKRLRNAADDPGSAPPINRFDDYVAGIASRLVDDLLRALFPQWTRLKHRVQYVLHHDNRFRVSIDAECRTICQPAVISTLGRRVRTSAAEALASAIVEILDDAGHPLTIDELVTAVEKCTGSAAEGLDAQPGLAAGPDDPSLEMESADDVRRVWSEIETLPYRQRVALLLSARDDAGESVLLLLAATGLASAEGLSAVLGIVEAELESLWDELPLSDATIAQRLGATRQQVVNLRKAARDRLARRTSRRR